MANGDNYRRRLRAASACDAPWSGHSGKLAHKMGTHWECEIVTPELTALREKVLSSPRAERARERFEAMPPGLMRYFDRDGSPLLMWQYLALNDCLDYKRVALDVLPDGTEVSTVWLGLDHGYGGARLIFESMTFPPAGSEAEQDQDRYSTEVEARAGHAAMVAKWSPKQ